MAEEQAKDSAINMEELFPSKDKQVDSEDAAKTDVKDATSSVEAKETEKETEAASLEEQVSGLTKELTRVRKSRVTSDETVQELREQLAAVRGQLQSLTAKDSSATNKLAKYSDEQLVHGQTEWEEELVDARASLRKAREDGNEASAERFERAIGVARATLNAVRTELLERTKRVGADQAKAQGEASRIVQDVVSIYDRAYESFPGLKDKDSELWQAGNETYNANPALMRQLGPLGELVAVAIAIAENPKLVGGAKEAKAARKELLSEINTKAEKSLIKGGGKAKVKGAPEFDAMSPSDFDAMVNKIKLGS